jgi:hypothetical protein
LFLSFLLSFFFLSSFRPSFHSFFLSLIPFLSFFLSFRIKDCLCLKQKVWFPQNKFSTKSVTFWSWFLNCDFYS